MKSQKQLLLVVLFFFVAVAGLLSWSMLDRQAKARHEAWMEQQQIELDRKADEFNRRDQEARQKLKELK